MEENEFKILEEKYFLIKRNKFFAFLGGFLAFLVATGYISYSSLNKKISDISRGEAIKKIEENVTKSDYLIIEIENSLEQINFIKYPVGSIIAFAGMDSAILESSNWMLCDGGELSRDTYDDLFKKIGIAWGKGNEISTFNIPDLRGLFLRGVDLGAGMDPDSDKRISRKGSNSGAKIGSYQDDEFESHNHLYGRIKTFENHPYSGERAEIPYHEKVDSTRKSGGNETRPRNAYVNWMIKVK